MKIVTRVSTFDGKEFSDERHARGHLKGQLDINLDSLVKGIRNQTGENATDESFKSWLLEKIKEGRFDLIKRIAMDLDEVIPA